MGSSGRNSGTELAVIPPEHDHRRAGLTAIAVVACWFCLSGVASCGETAVRFAKGPAEKAAAHYSKAPVKLAAERFVARSTLVERPASRTLVTVPSEAEAATAVKQDERLLDQARAAAANVDQLIDETTKNPTARTRAKGCLKGSTKTAAGKVVTDAADDSRERRPVSIDVEPMIIPVFSSCLQKAYPKEAAPIKVLGQGLSRMLAAHSAEVSETDATAQDYVDWLLYSAELAAEPDVESPPPEPEVEPSAEEASVDDLLVAVSDAHRGRLAVRRKEWQAAIDNRTNVIGELKHLRGQVAPALEPSRKLLLQAMLTSVRSDRKHDRCGDRCAARLDRRATAEKQAFVRAYHPYFAKKYTGRLHERDF
jgi:hypothetical protein